MMQFIAQRKANSVTTVKCTIIFKLFAVGPKTMETLEAVVEATHKIIEADTIAVKAKLEAVAEVKATLAVEAVVEVKAEARTKNM